MVEGAFDSEFFSVEDRRFLDDHLDRDESAALLADKVAFDRKIQELKEEETPSSPSSVNLESSTNTILALSLLVF